MRAAPSTAMLVAMNIETFGPIASHLLQIPSKYRGRKIEGQEEKRKLGDIFDGDRFCYGSFRFQYGNPPHFYPSAFLNFLAHSKAFIEDLAAVPVRIISVMQNFAVLHWCFLPTECPRYYWLATIREANDP